MSFLLNLIMQKKYACPNANKNLQHSLASFITSPFGFISISYRPDCVHNIIYGVYHQIIKMQYGYIFQFQKNNMKPSDTSSFIAHDFKFQSCNRATSPPRSLGGKLLLTFLLCIRHVFDPSANATQRLHVLCAVCRDSGGLGLRRLTDNLGGLVNGCARWIGAHRHRLCEAV